MCRFMRRCINKCGVAADCKGDSCRCEALDPDENDRMKLPSTTKQALCNIMCVDWPFTQGTGMEQLFDLDTVWSEHFEALEDAAKTVKNANDVTMRRVCPSSSTSVQWKDALTHLKDVLEFMLVTLGGLNDGQFKVWLSSQANFTDASMGKWQRAVLVPVLDED